jgi:hypothetical protein
MSNQTSADHTDSNSTASDRNSNVNARIDSSFRPDPSHRGSLTPPELDSIHQTNSFKQAKLLEQQDNRELTTKKKQQQSAKEPTKS